MTENLSVTERPAIFETPCNCGYSGYSAGRHRVSSLAHGLPFFLEGVSFTPRRKIMSQVLRAGWPVADGSHRWRGLHRRDRVRAARLRHAASAPSHPRGRVTASRAPRRRRLLALLRIRERGPDQEHRAARSRQRAAGFEAHRQSVPRLRAALLLRYGDWRDAR